MSHARLFLASLLIGAAAVAGCGGGASVQSKTDFTSQYGAASDDFKTRMAAAQTDAKAAVQGQSIDSEAKVFSAMQAITEDTLATMRPMRPPSSYADDFAAVRSALTAQRDALRKVLAASKSADASALNAALQSYATALTSWQSSATQLDASLGRGPARAGPHA